MNFAEIIKSNQDLKLTENGAIAYSTTSNCLVDFFAQAGALRDRSEEAITKKFAEAFQSNPLYATKLLFHVGNIRGGLGERRTFKICLKWLANNYPSIMKKNIALIPYFNRWDSLFVLIGTPVEKDMYEFVLQTLINDLQEILDKKEKANISLLAKWLPSENTSSKQSRELAKKFISYFKIHPKIYRKTLSALRQHLDVTERKMSMKEWDKIEYSKVPSYAIKNYRKAFGRHDTERFEKYKEMLQLGRTKVNSSVLYPYDLVKDYVDDYDPYNRNVKEDTLIEEQWKALPNYVEGNNDVLIVADISGSMTGRPMCTSVGLAIYFAQRNKGAYKNLFMTFSENPKFINLKDSSSLKQSVEKVLYYDNVGYSTDLRKTFLSILGTAVNNRIKQEDMPAALVVISDMEIDGYRYQRFDFLKEMKELFNANGYKLPKLVLWNVEARNDTFLTKDENVLQVSGQSPSVFKNLCGILEGKTQFDLMLEVLDQPMYANIRI